MDIRQLEAYVYTVKYRSFSLAAQKLYLSQPTVSAHICNLEKELHTQLLKRTTKTLSVTPAGRCICCPSCWQHTTRRPRKSGSAPAARTVWM